MLAETEGWYHLVGVIKLSMSAYGSWGVIRHARGTTNELSATYTAMLYVSAVWWFTDMLRVGTCTFPDGSYLYDTADHAITIQQMRD